jgi:hypothetical protein
MMPGNIKRRKKLKEKIRTKAGKRKEMISFI